MRRERSGYKTQAPLHISAYSSFVFTRKRILFRMQQKFIALSLALLVAVAAVQAAPGVAPFAGSAASFAGLPSSPGGPLAISSSQRLDYFNQLNAAFAPPARLLATPAGLAAFPAIFGFPAAARFSPLAAGNAPFFF